MSEQETWTEWGVRRTWGMVGSVAKLDRRSAEMCAKDWPGELVSRTVTAGEWTPVIPPANTNPAALVEPRAHTDAESGETHE